MDVTLIIPAHNEEGFIGACLDSVEQHARGFFKEVIVVDNASTDKTADVARARGARVIREEKKGLTRARQAGFEAATGEWVACIDADCRLSPTWVEVARRYLAAYEDAVSLSGPVRYYDGPRILRLVIVLAEWVALPLTSYMTRYLIIGGNFIAKRVAIEQVGGFDRSIAFFGEDADIARRLEKIGRVAFHMDFYVLTSMRRFQSDGFLRTVTNYVLNYLWHVFFKRSYTTVYTDVRS